jgi:hypothetical protein
MEKPEAHFTRKFRQLRVPVLPGEEQEIKHLAAASGLPVAAYLRELGLNHQVRGMLDNKRVEELARIHGELSRVSGFLKLWLADDPRVAFVGAAALHAALSKIEATQGEIHQLMCAVVLHPNSRQI